MLVATTATIALVGLVCGTALAAAAKFLAVEEDPRIAEAEACLPGANCGGCGYAGCADYAKAIVLNDASINLCAPGGAATLAALAAMMGVEAAAADRKVALVLCGGNSTNAARKHLYNGVADCAAAAAVGGGDKKCSYGCLGYGSCARVCPVGAIELADGLAVIHAALCISCSACVKACPRTLIKMVPDSRTVHVLCSSKDKGPIVKKACTVGCIGCRICTKLVEDEAIGMDGFLAIVDYDKAIVSDVVAAKCPGKCIINTAPTEDAATEAGQTGR